ncbi:MAG: hypothetical protein K2I46_04110 [Clostridia bacterium]|nr:hypothetical protein [Clostridia bacterium]MDE6471656.1 hypothetical protein [Clostridia bacterium]
MEKQRLSFEERIKELDEASIEYYNRLQAHLLSYRGVKSRLSLRCDSYRAGKELISKISIGGNSLKIFLAIDPEKEEFAQKKVKFRSVAESEAYKEVPAMIPVKSQLCVRKVCEVIDVMMSQRGLVKN